MEIMVVGIVCFILGIMFGLFIKKKPKVIGSLIINDTNDDIDTQCVLLQLDDRLDYLEAGELVAVRITKQI